VIPSFYDSIEIRRDKILGWFKRRRAPAAAPEAAV
jgi:hypothetical protein